jgi:hypothetical protein
MSTAQCVGTRHGYYVLTSVLPTVGDAPKK